MQRYRRAASEPHLVQLKEYLDRHPFDLAADTIMYKPYRFLDWWYRDSGYGGEDWDEYIFFPEDEEAGTFRTFAVWFADLDDDEMHKFLRNNIDADIVEDYYEEEGALTKLTGDADAPSHVYLDYRRDLGDTWLIHFTKKQNVLRIQQNGFQYGVEDHRKLGWTTHIRKQQKRGPGYGFAYTVDDYPEYLVHPDGARRWHAGAVLFRAEALYLQHKVDQDRQAVFWGPSAYDVVALLPESAGRFNDPKNDVYAVLDCDGSYVMTGDNLDTVVQWTIQNIDRHPNLACI